MSLLLLIASSSLAIAETPGMYVAPLLPNLEFAMVKPADAMPSTGYASVVNTGGSMLALHNDGFPGVTQVVDGDGYTVVVYLDTLPVIAGWGTDPTTGLPAPIVSGSFASVMLPCVGAIKPVTYVDVGGATSASFSATPVTYRKMPGLLGVDTLGRKVLAADQSAEAQVAIDARTGILVKYYLGYGFLQQSLPSNRHVLRTASGIVSYGWEFPFGDSQCQE